MRLVAGERFVAATVASKALVTQADERFTFDAAHTFATKSHRLGNLTKGHEHAGFQTKAHGKYIALTLGQNFVKSFDEHPKMLLAFRSLINRHSVFISERIHEEIALIAANL